MKSIISIAVCDDEVVACCGLAERIRSYMESAGVLYEIRTFTGAGDFLRANEHFDIIFMDIIMPELDGMRAAEQLRKKQTDSLLIFITSSKRYVFDAYEVEAFQYLVKPVPDEKLQRVLERAVLKKAGREEDFLVIQQERSKKKIMLRDIYYIEIRGRIVDVHAAEGVFLFFLRMGALERALTEKGFSRCHKSFLVNLRYVSVFNKQQVTLDNGGKIPVAKRRYDAFSTDVLTYMRGNGGIL